MTVVHVQAYAERTRTLHSRSWSPALSIGASAEMTRTHGVHDGADGKGKYKNIIIDNALLTVAMRYGVGKQFAQLPNDLRHHPFAAGVHLERFTNPLDPRWRTARLTDAFRALIWEVDDHTLLVWNIVHHPEDERLAARHYFHADQLRGGVYAGDVRVVEAVAPREVSPATPERLRLAVADRDLLSIGMPPDLVRLVRCLRNPDDLNALANLAPSNTPFLVATLRLHEGDSLEAVDAELRANPPGMQPPIDITQAINQDIRRGSLRVISENTDLEKALSGEWDLWQLFLHKDQAAIVKKKRNGPCRVTGGPGTGKTVVALHRVKHLLKKQGGLALEAPPILLTSFSKSTTLALRTQLLRLLGPEEVARVHVAHMDRLTGEILGREDHVLKGRTILDSKAVTTRFAAVMEGRDMKLPPAAVAQFWDNVLVALPERTYDAAKELGLHMKSIPRLTPQLFDQLVNVVNAVEAGLDAASETSHTMRAREALRVVQRTGPQYSHIVVDEAQDLYPVHGMLLRALVAEGPNDIFLVGDAAQRIYRQPFALSSVGIKTHNRSHCLHLAYRSSREILAFASTLLVDQQLDDMDGTETFKTEEQAIVSGKAPVLRGFTDEAAESQGTLVLIKDLLTSGVKPEEILLLAPWNTRCHYFAEQLQTQGIEATLLEQQVGEQPKGILVATYFRAKGFEARVAIVTGAGATYTEQVSADGPGRDQRVRALYVACTRPRDELHVLWHGRPSPLIYKSPITS